MKPLWSPSLEHQTTTHMYAFMKYTAQQDYQQLYNWSITNLEQFWSAVWDFCEVRAQTQGEAVLINPTHMPGGLFFPHARLNYAENLLRRKDDSDAIVFWGEDKVKRRLSWGQLYDLVSRIRQLLVDTGVTMGDRVVAFVPNIPETVAAMLATTSLGAVWSSCSPDFGLQGVIDRFGQIEAKVLFATEGYFYNGKTHDCLERIQAFLPQLPTIQKTIIFSYTQNLPSLDSIPHASHLEHAIKPYTPKTIDFPQLPFHHPLFIMFSSGTTGKPKCIIHCAGGILLQLLKEHKLHCDVKPQDRIFYFTTCGWMMWNWLITALASEACLLLYDGSPFYLSGNILFDYAQSERMTLFGTSAKFIDSCQKAALHPHKTHNLQTLKTITSTGSPLQPEAFDYVYTKVKPDVHLASISGGTDLLSCFALGNPIAPVWRGELQTPGLGMAVEVFDDNGISVKQQKGELVCTKPFPSMPIGFWNDPDNTRYYHTYFARYPHVWHHGDYVSFTEHDGLIFYGRSDTVLNPGGVRIGTAEIYRQVEALLEVEEALVIGQEWENDTRIVLFVRLREEKRLDEDLIHSIKQGILKNCTPRHVPAKIIQVSDIPRTRSGKIVELAVSCVVHGQPVKNLESLENPQALKQFKNLPELQF